MKKFKSIKKILPLLILVFSFSTQVVLADVIPMGKKYIPGCAILKNVSDFADVKFIAATYDRGSPANPYNFDFNDKPTKITLLENSTCLSSGRYTSVEVFAVTAENYQKLIKAQNYDPQNDLNAYPLDPAHDAEGFETYQAMVDIASKDTYIHREYIVQGFDNSRRVIVITHTADVTNQLTQDYAPKTAPANLDNALKLDTAVFKDISLNSPYTEAVLALKRQKMVQGYGDGTYQPSKLINRAEFVKIIMSDHPRDYDCSKQIFKDVSPEATNWYRNPVCWAYGEYAIQGEERVISGYPDGTFKPEQNINFAEAAKIIIGAERVSPGQKTDPWYKQYISIFEKINAVPSTIKSPSQLITRGEMALLIYKINENRDKL